MLRLLLLVITFIAIFYSGVKAQFTIAFQGGEGTAADNWLYTPIANAGGPLTPGITSSFPNTGFYSLRAGGGNNVGCSGGANCLVGGGATGCPMHGKDILFNTVNVACLDNVQLSFYHRSHSYCSGNGFDSGESVRFEVNINGSGWIEVGRVGGFADYAWDYSTNPAGHPSSGYTAPNPFVYNVPAGTSTFAFRARGFLNRSDEIYYLDDVTLTTTTPGYSFPGTAGLWNGIISTDWHDACNWDSRLVPTASTNVTIPNGALKICEILAGATGDCRNIVIDKSKLAVENATSVLNVNGNLTIEANGELDMSLNAATGGTLNLVGSWLNKRDETWFVEDGSTVNVTGNGGQSITVVNDTKEAFYKLHLNKPAGNLITYTDIWIDKFIAGGLSAMMNFSSGLLDLNMQELLVFNPNVTAVQRTGGGVITERTDNASRVTWKAGGFGGSYVFPFTKTTGVYIPFTCQVISGPIGDITISTYPTPPDNLPWPSVPVNVQNLASAAGLMPDNRDATVDRFWQIDVTGSGTANLFFTYEASELPIAPYNNPNSLKAQRYEPSTDYWQPYLPGQTASAFQVTLPGASNFGTWTLTNEVSPLPVSLLFFDVRLEGDKARIEWVTATEINNDFFTVERSHNGTDFEAVSIVQGAGNSSTLLRYYSYDPNPFQGVSYYRLKQTDFDGRFTYSAVKAVKLNSTLQASPEIFPNPAENHFYISGGENASGRFVIISDITGKVIQTSEVSHASNNSIIRVDLKDVSPGLYFVSFNGGMASKLIVK